MISTRKAQYRFEYCGQNSYNTFVGCVKQKTTAPRVCYLGVENIRVFLSVVDGSVILEFFKRVERTWEALKKLPRFKTPSLEAMLRSAKEFEQELAEAFFFSFPHAEEAYYDDLPSHREVLSAIAADPSLECLQEMMYIHSQDLHTAVEDADGIVTIVCEDGTVCIPFELYEGSSALQIDRAKFHPDSWASTLFNGFFDWCAGIHSRLSAVTVTSVLQSIDKHI